MSWYGKSNEGSEWKEEGEEKVISFMISYWFDINSHVVKWTWFLAYEVPDLNTGRVTHKECV